MSAPLFTVASALFNVEAYVGAYLSSLDTQSFDHGRIEILVVDDGSTDASAEIVRRWADRTDFSVRVLSKPNGGQASARNLALEHATGEWVTFIDPDDRVSENYFADVARLVGKHADVHLVNMDIRVLNELEPGVERVHPRRPMFRRGNHVANLDRAVERFPGSAPTSFFRRSVIEEHGLRFNELLRPNFEDGDFALRFLLLAPTRRVGFIDSAKYFYLKRTSSTLGSMTSHPGRFTVVPELGYLDCLEFARERFGHVPMWVQHMILYELWWYFNGETTRVRLGGDTASELGPQFVDLLRRIGEHLDPALVDSTTIRAWDRTWVAVLLHGLDGRPWSADHVEFDGLQEHSEFVRVRHLRTPDAPAPVFRTSGATVTPTHHKTRSLDFWGETRLVEDIAWLPRTRWLSVESEAGPLEWRPLRTGPVLRHPTPGQLNRVLHGPKPVTEPVRVTRRDRSRYADAWILCDRVHDADDSGEALFKHLRRNHGDINAWFAIEKDSPDWHRLRKEGHGSRLLAHGSDRWSAAMTLASHLVSSHADQAIHDPPALRGQLRDDLRFVFLQHGVIKDDLSDWLNPKKIDLFVTSTPDEHESIVGDGTRYVFTTREARLTGLPRFDVLLAEAQRTQEGDRDLILVAPTWRSWLAAPLATGEQRRGATTKIAQTQFGREWGAFLRSPELSALARQHDARVALLAHPNLAASLEYLDLPDEIEVLSFDDAAAKRHFARTRLMVTDYSSMAFNAAYLDRPVVYFQFDRDAMLSGAHVGRRGYFDYDSKGVGPATTTLAATIAAVGAALDHGPTPAQPYLDRMAQMFPHRDGRCCERVVDAIVNLDRG
jgi:glycosyltransferase involved in cell wall biosynthesis